MVAAAYTVSPSHEMQAIAALVAFQNATPIVDIVEVAYRKSVNPFINFYLRNVQCTHGDGTYGIFSLATAQTVVTLNSLDSR